MKTKKLLSVLLILAIVFALAACGGQPDAAETPDTPTAAPGGTETDMPSYKIGILCHTNSGGCWERMMDAADYMAEELNLDIVTAVGATPTPSSARWRISSLPVWTR